MRTHFGCLLYIIILVSCSQPGETPSTFDKQVSDQIDEYDYEVSEITDEEFARLKDNIDKKHDALHYTLSPYALIYYVNRFNPSISDLTNKYKQLEEPGRLAFLKGLMVREKKYFDENRMHLLQLIRDLKTNPEQQLTRELLLLYTSSHQPAINGFKTLLSQKRLLNLPEQLLLARMIETEKETDLGFQLLTYLHTRKDWSTVMSYIHYYALSNTRNAVLNEKYKAFFREELNTRDLNQKPWKGNSALMAKWFTPEEITVICKSKLRQTKTYHYYFRGKVQELSTKELYTILCSYYQAAHFPVAETIGLIEACRLPYLKLHLAFILSNTRNDMSDSDHHRLLDVVRNTASSITTAEESALFILTIKSLEPQHAFDQISKALPAIAKNNYNPDSLQQNLQAAEYHWKTFIDSCNQQNTFRIPLKEPDEFTLNETMVPNNALRLNNPLTIETILSASGLLMNLSGEYGKWPDDYALFESSTAALSAIKDIQFQFISDPEREDSSLIRNTFYLKLKNTLHKVSFSPEEIRASHEVAYLLINKSLMDAGIKERLVNIYPDGYTLVFAEPDKYAKLAESLNIRSQR